MGYPQTLTALLIHLGCLPSRWHWSDDKSLYQLQLAVYHLHEYYLLDIDGLPSCLAACLCNVRPPIRMLSG
jgi:hypothetical protein